MGLPYRFFPEGQPDEDCIGLSAKRGLGLMLWGISKKQKPLAFYRMRETLKHLPGKYIRPSFEFVETTWHQGSHVWGPLGGGQAPWGVIIRTSHIGPKDWAEDIERLKAITEDTFLELGDEIQRIMRAGSMRWTSTEVAI